MIKGLAITPPVIGRISIGRVVEKNGKRLPEKDDQFTITTQIQTKEGWLPHPLDEALRQEVQGKKLRSIPVTESAGGVHLLRAEERQAAVCRKRRDLPTPYREWLGYSALPVTGSVRLRQPRAL